MIASRSGVGEPGRTRMVRDKAAKRAHERSGFATIVVSGRTDMTKVHLPVKLSGSCWPSTFNSDEKSPRNKFALCQVYQSRKVNRSYYTAGLAGQRSTMARYCTDLVQGIPSTRAGRLAVQRPKATLLRNMRRE